MTDTFFKREHPTMEFIGVTTKQSSIMTLFPKWAKAMRLEDARLEGRDLTLDASREAYRDAVLQFRLDPQSRGALVTTHKINILNAASDLFDELDPYAQLCGEVSCIVQREGKLYGYAKDPITSRRALADVAPAGYFEQNGQVLMFGAGGAGTAILVALLERPESDQPRQIIVTDPAVERLEALRKVHHQLRSRVPLFTLQNVDPIKNAEFLGSLPSHSLVINASGLGKDRPGSPLPAATNWPDDATAWELNYRGSLEFFHQAKAAGIRTIDGWVYFLHGWSEAITEVFGIQWNQALFEHLRTIAEGK